MERTRVTDTTCSAWASVGRRLDARFAGSIKVRRLSKRFSVGESTFGKIIESSTIVKLPTNSYGGCHIDIERRQ
jgi:hypothetical protein